MPEQEAELFVLMETAAGYLLVHVKEWDSIAQDMPTVQESMLDPKKFGQVVEVKAAYPFANADEALENCQAIANSESTELLRSFLDQNLPKKRKRCQLGVLDPLLGKNLASHEFPVLYEKNILELTRLCRVHIKRLMKQLGKTDLMKFQVGLGHNYSRHILKSDPHRQDKPVQNAVALVESLDKMVNTFSMRLKEWYCWHFPELSKVVTDNVMFAHVARLVRVKEDFTENRFGELVEVVNGDEEMARAVFAAKDVSMGQEIVEADMVNIDRFAGLVIKLAEERAHLTEYLGAKLSVVAPNLQSLVGDVLAAKLIAHAGSLTNLAKCPASTVQILGAEKALFRALKTKGNTPKYGLLFQSSFIGRASPKHKGRVSRYLANKCSLASRIDNFATIPCGAFGEKMRNQVECRMAYLVGGVATRKNLDVMREAHEEFAQRVAQIEKKNQRRKKNAKAKEQQTADQTAKDEKADEKAGKKAGEKETKSDETLPTISPAAMLISGEEERSKKLGKKRRRTADDDALDVEAVKETTKKKKQRK